MSANRAWILERRPDGALRPEDLVLRAQPRPEAEEGGIVYETLFLSIDATNRVWMNAQASYLPPVPLGGPMRGVVCARVLESRAEGFAPGDVVWGLGAWAAIGAGPAKAFTPYVAPPGAPPLGEAFAIFSLAGPTAWIGVHVIGGLKAGETFTVNAAAGSVGALAGQIAKAAGAGRVVGIAGGPEKCAHLTETLGFDAAIDHRAEPKLGKALRAACPDGIDVHFENVGGAHLEAAIANIAVGARIVFCGAVGDYDRAEGPVPVRGLANLVMRRGRLEGYIVTDHVKRYPEAIAAMSRLIAEGRLKYAVETHDGVETAYAALTGLLAGANTGKTIVKFADP